MTRRLRINMADLEMAFESSFGESSSYLDLESGDVLFVTEDARIQFERLTAEAEAAVIELEEVLSTSDVPDWEKEYPPPTNASVELASMNEP